MALIKGTTGADSLNGTAGADTIRGLSGDDTLVGGGGKDLLYGGSGNDTFLSSNAPGEIVAGEAVYGGTGDDTFILAMNEQLFEPIDLTGITFDSIEHLVVESYNIAMIKATDLHQFKTLSGTTLLAGGGSAVYSGTGLGLFNFTDSATRFDGSASIGGLWVRGGAGDDTIIASVRNDTLLGGGGNDLISGGDGNDTIWGNAGKDDLRGGAGDDVFEFDTDADTVAGEIVRGGAGFDTIRMNRPRYTIGAVQDFTGVTLDGIEAITWDNNWGTGKLTAAQVGALKSLSGEYVVSGTGVLDLAGKRVAGASFGIAEGMTGIDGSKGILGTDAFGLSLSGNEGANRITGTRLNDTLYGNGGNDTLLGLSGDDWLIGGAGNDRLNGGSGTDKLEGGTGTDVLLGQDGDDFLTYAEPDGAGRDTYDGGEGTDELVLSPDARDVDLSRQIVRGIEVFRSDYATITMTAAQFTQAKVLQGSFAIAGSGTLTLANTELYYFQLTLSDAGNTVDASTVSSDYFTIYGGAGKDTVLGGTGVDYLFGGAGDDTLRGNAGADQLRGDEGNDLLDGGAGNDMLVGGAGKDTMRGGAGDDALVIASSADVTAGEIYDGGDGTDRLLIQGTDDFDVRTFAMTSIEGLDSTYLIHIKATNAQLGSFKTLGAANYVLTEGGTITFKGNVAAGTFFGAIFTMSDLGNTLDFRGATLDKVAINGGAGNDTAWASGGNDNFGLLGGNDTAYGLGGNDLINGGAGNDRLDGGEGDDILFGGDGTDTLIGGAGNDTFGGGSGADVQTGGAGADGFVFSGFDLAASRSATDRITDFSHAEGDRIDVSLIDANAVTFGDEAFRLVSGAFTAAGQLRVVQEAGNTFVEMNTNADTIADLVIRLDGLKTLVAADFVL